MSLLPFLVAALVQFAPSPAQASIASRSRTVPYTVELAALPLPSGRFPPDARWSKSLAQGKVVVYNTGELFKHHLYPRKLAEIEHSYTKEMLEALEAELQREQSQARNVVLLEMKELSPSHGYVLKFTLPADIPYPLEALEEVNLSVLRQLPKTRLGSLQIVSSGTIWIAGERGTQLVPPMRRLSDSSAPARVDKALEKTP